LCLIVAVVACWWGRTALRWSLWPVKAPTTLRREIGITLVVLGVAVELGVAVMVFGGLGELVDSIDTAASQHCGLDQSHGVGERREEVCIRDVIEEWWTERIVMLDESEERLMCV
jgi:hypothetical protein